MTSNARLDEVAAAIAGGNPPEPVTVRAFLSWFGAKRRRSTIVRRIRFALKERNLLTIPDFEAAFLDSEIQFQSSDSEAAESPHRIDATVHTIGLAVSAVLGDGVTVSDQASSTVIGVSADPTYRLSKLSAANNPPRSVPPDSTVREAVTLMLLYDFSQLPVMQSEREVKGVVSWETIGSQLALGHPCVNVRDCMKSHHEISEDVSLFAAISGIVQHQYVLVRGADRKIKGIVTTTDLSLQFSQLAEPFLLLGEIENHIRVVIDATMSLEQIQAARDPADDEREVESAADLTFGEYIRLLENEERWGTLKLPVDRRVFVDQLNRIRDIRNDVMHFDPDGVPEEDMDVLKRFVALLQRLRSVGAA